MSGTHEMQQAKKAFRSHAWSEAVLLCCELRPILWTNNDVRKPANAASYEALAYSQV